MRTIAVAVLLVFAMVAAAPAPAEAWGDVLALVGVIVGIPLAALGIKKAMEKKPAEPKKTGESPLAAPAPALEKQATPPPAIAIPQEEILAR